MRKWDAWGRLGICCREDRVKPALSTMEHVWRKSHKSNFNSLRVARSLPPSLSPPRLLSPFVFPVVHYSSFFTLRLYLFLVPLKSYIKSASSKLLLYKGKERKKKKKREKSAGIQFLWALAHFEHCSYYTIMCYFVEFWHPSSLSGQEPKN